MEQGLNEALALFRASIRKSPSLMMEAVAVDSNRGVTARGNSPYDQFASPATRAKVLEARMQEIEAFAQRRKIPTSNVYAVVEVAMRTGKIPDLGQFGLAGDDAVATKQFIISDILNIAGLEWTDYKGDPVEVDDSIEQSVEESVKGKPQHGLTSKMVRKLTGKGLVRNPVNRSGFDDEGGPTKNIRRKKLGLERGNRPIIDVEENYDTTDPRYFMAEGSTKAGGYPFDNKEKHYRGHSDAELNFAHRDAVKAARNSGSHDTHAENWYMDDAATIRKEMNKRKGRIDSSVDIDYDLYVAEEGGPYRSGGAPERASLSPSRQSAGADAPINPMNYMRQDLLPKPVMKQLMKIMGDGVYSLSREDLFRLARERGLLGTEESVEWVNEDAETDLRARREANRAAVDAAKSKREGKTSAEAEQIARARATGQKGLASGAASKGNLWKHRYTDQQNLSQIGSAAATGAQQRQQTQQRRTTRAGSQGAWQSQFAGQQTQAQAAQSALGAKKPESIKSRQFMRQSPITKEDVNSDSQQLLNESGHLGAAGNDRSAGSAGLSSAPGPTEPPYTKNKRKQTEAEKILGIEPGDPRSESWPQLGAELRALIGECVPNGDVAQDVDETARMIERQRVPTAEEIEAEEKALSERSETDKILGITPGDPRAETWPKLSSEMQRLLNLEDCGVFSGRRGFNMPDEDAQIEEMTVSGSMGGFIGAGISGSGITGRTCAMPSYDDSYELPEDPKKRIALLKKMLDKHGLKKPMKEADTDPTSAIDPESPTMRSNDYNDHPSRWMN